MTISQFTGTLGMLKIRWRVTREGWIRGPDNICPIQAVANIELVALSEDTTSARHLEKCARKLSLSLASRDKIINAADNTKRADPKLRNALLVACRLRGPDEFLIPEHLDHPDVL